MTFWEKLERKIGWIAIPRIGTIIIMGQVVALLMQMTSPGIAEFMAYVPAKVIQGEVWRIFAIFFIPPPVPAGGLGILFLLIEWYIFYLMTSALESTWGTFKLTCYILVGALIVMVTAFIAPNSPVQNGFLLISVFLAFAYLFPDFELLLFFVLPVKVKWLGIIAGAGYLLYAFTIPLPFKLIALSGVGNFVVFFSRDIVLRLRSGQKKAARKAEKAKAAAEPFHTCDVCGATDLSHPEREFRYRDDRAICSECLEKESYSEEEQAKREQE